ncbi:uncharacterized protein N0V89_004797 [Didymosphaeria variabile]|uniref:Uncharacterized protein n=1 Tax=Didymosphaeria variabile TaxID=1932322 RepID=A0A9W8XRW2_9PLEO|nr:uncharacterized protein N0V89_004797 [Didymosphaeria variabile]KAJ4356761.1 hypothetical protein N0V89_004797 [Didymosphaeria variabile]
MGAFVPYAAAKAQPQLFEPTPNSSSFQDLLAQGAARIFIAPAAASKKSEISAAWSKILETVGKDGMAGQWSGWGVEGDEGTWAGILSWKGGEELERSSTNASVVEAVQELKGLAELDEYEVSFTSTPDSA